MKELNIYSNKGFVNSNQVFNYLINNLKETIKTYDFFVAWNKVLGNVKLVEIPLNILNSLIGKSNIEQCMKELIISYPEIVPVIPILHAIREKAIKVADIGRDVLCDFNRKTSYSYNEIEEIVKFCRLSGILNLFKDKNIKNLVDYVTGIEVGLDSNARKNRTGFAMENLCELYIKDLCDKNGYDYLKQANVSKIMKEYGVEVPTDKANRSYDFVINNNGKLTLIEVNYYSGGGSKLKSVAGEFMSLARLFNDHDNIDFLWITDGMGWLTTKSSLLEAFNLNDYIINIKMIEDGFLEQIIKRD